MKNPSPETMVLVKEWIFYAEEDFRNAEHTLTMTENCPFSTVCFHAQQVVEKYIKAFLTLRAIPFARTHDIENLIHQLLEDIQIPLSVEEHVCSLIMQRSVVILENGNLLIAATQNRQSNLQKKSAK